MRKDDASKDIGETGTQRFRLFNYGAHVSVGYYDQTLGQLSAQKSVLNEVWDDHYTK